MNDSDQAAHASARLRIPFYHHLRPVGIQKRGLPCVLRLLSNHAGHDRSLHRYSVYGLRIIIPRHESIKTVRPDDALCRRRSGWWHRRCSHDAIGRDQDTPSDTRNGVGSRDTKLQGLDRSGVDHQAKRGICGFLARTPTSYHHHHAEHSHMLVSRACMGIYTSSLTSVKVCV